MEDLTKEEREWVNERVAAFQKYLDSLPDGELDRMISEIEAQGFEGPTVDEYFESIGFTAAKQKAGQ